MKQAWQSYAAAKSGAEQELASIRGLVGTDMDKHVDRVDGPKLQIKNAAGPATTSSGGRANPVSRVWRLSHGWLA